MRGDAHFEICAHGNVLLDASVREGNSTGSDFTQFQYMDRAGKRCGFRTADLKDGLYRGQLSTSISGQ